MPCDKTKVELILNPHTNRTVSDLSKCWFDFPKNEIQRFPTCVTLLALSHEMFFFAWDGGLVGCLAGAQRHSSKHWGMPWSTAVNISSVYSPRVVHSNSWGHGAFRFLLSLSSAVGCISHCPDTARVSQRLDPIRATIWWGQVFCWKRCCGTGWTISWKTVFSCFFHRPRLLQIDPQPVCATAVLAEKQSRCLSKQQATCIDSIGHCILAKTTLKAERSLVLWHDASFSVSWQSICWFTMSHGPDSECLMAMRAFTIGPEGDHLRYTTEHFRHPGWKCVAWVKNTGLLKLLWTRAEALKDRLQQRDHGMISDTTVLSLWPQKPPVL